MTQPVPIDDQIEEAELHRLGLGHQAGQLDLNKRVDPAMAQRCRDRQVVAAAIVETLRDVKRGRG